MNARNQRCKWRQYDMTESHVAGHGGRTIERFERGGFPAATGWLIAGDLLRGTHVERYQYGFIRRAAQEGEYVGIVQVDCLVGSIAQRPVFAAQRQQRFVGVEDGVRISPLPLDVVFPG